MSTRRLYTLGMGLQDETDDEHNERMQRAIHAATDRSDHETAFSLEQARKQMLEGAERYRTEKRRLDAIDQGITDVYETAGLCRKKCEEVATAAGKAAFEAAEHKRAAEREERDAREQAALPHAPAALADLLAVLQKHDIEIEVSDGTGNFWIRGVPYEALKVDSECIDVAGYKRVVS